MVRARSNEFSVTLVCWPKRAPGEARYYASPRWLLNAKTAGRVELSNASYPTRGQCRSPGRAQLRYRCESFIKPTLVGCFGIASFVALAVLVFNDPRRTRVNSEQTHRLIAHGTEAVGDIGRQRDAVTGAQFRWCCFFAF
ncbi:MAG: hypothetical protein ACI9W2_002528 [Gammaproteobacteria bacterium]